MTLYNSQPSWTIPTINISWTISQYLCCYWHGQVKCDESLWADHPTNQHHLTPTGHLELATSLLCLDQQPTLGPDIPISQAAALLAQFGQHNFCTQTTDWITVVQLGSFNAQLIPFLTRLHVVVPELPQRFCAADFAEIELHYASCNGNLSLRTRMVRWKSLGNGWKLM